jgi:hypothetical protein
VLSAHSSDLKDRLDIGTVEGAQLSASLTATGGTLTVANGNLKLSDFASTALQGLSGCPIPPGSSIGAVTTAANVQ